MNPKCDCCKAELPAEFLVEMDLVNEQTNQIEAKLVCQECASEFERNTWELEHAKVYDPALLVSPNLLSSTSSCFIEYSA